MTIKIKGEWKWIDGTPCDTDDGLCTSFWDWDTDNEGDIWQGPNADCGFFTVRSGIVVDGRVWDGTVYLELGCDGMTQTLCNAPLALPSEPSVSPTESPETPLSPASLCQTIPPHPSARQYIPIPAPREDYSNYTQAQRLCQDMYGTDLATIITQQDQENAFCEMYQNRVGTAWIGLNDIATEGMS